MNNKNSISPKSKDINQNEVKDENDIKAKKRLVKWKRCYLHKEE